MAARLRAVEPAKSTPVTAFDVIDPALCANDTWRPWFVRLAELQFQVLATGQPEYVARSFVHGDRRLPVAIERH